MGEQGEQGPPGAGYYIQSTTWCWGDVTQGGQYAFSLVFSAVEYSNGDVWVACEIRDSEGTFSSSRYFDSSQNGAASHGCSVAREDAAVPGSYGFWAFTLESTGYVAEYMNTASTNDGFVFEFDGTSSQDNGCDTLVRGR